MADYIKREDAIDAITEQMHEYMIMYSNAALGCRAAAKKIESIPSADVQPVVRCKDCKNLSFVDRFCYKNSIFVCSMDWFCAGGERRDGRI